MNQDTVRPLEVYGVGDGEDLGDDGRDEEENEEPGARTLRKVLDPREPSPEERREHVKTHLPYRNWCLDCCMGRGNELPCRTSDEEAVVPEVSMDFCFLGQEGEPGRTMPVLVAKEGAIHRPPSRCLDA